MNMINRAKDYVYIFTPYLIPDNEMIKALQNAAKSGVDVRIVMPGIPDKKIVFWVSQSYYEPLIECGVRIYQFTPGFLHAKCFVSDDVVATVGSINMDYRSLYLHFECAAFLYQNPVIEKMEEDYQYTLQSCQRITIEDCKRYGILKKYTGQVLRIVAPLM